MGLPDSVTVEVAFDSDPLDPAPVWTDITEYVEAKQQTVIRRGRASEFEQVQPGTLSLTLDNTDGRFTAGLSSSPYYPNVTINRRIRVTAVHDSVTYYLFDGHVDRWPVGWQGGVRALATITATDRTKLLARRPIRTLLEEEVLADEPVLFWPLAEPSGSSAAGDVSRVGSPYTLQVVDHKDGAGDLHFGDDWRMLYSTAPAWDNAVRATPSDPAPQSFLYGDASAVPTSGELSYELWVKVGQLDYSGSLRRVMLLFVGDNQGSHLTLEMFGEDSGPFVGTAGNYYADGRLVWDEDVWSIADGEWHHIVHTIDAAGTRTTYVDAEVYYSAASTPFTRRSGGWIWIGGYVYGLSSPNPFLGLVFNGQIARVAFYDTALSTTRIQAHYDAGRASFQELSSDRVERLAGYADIPLGTIQEGGSYVAADQDTAGKGVNASLQEVATSEDGLVFFAGDGTLTFHSRGHRINQVSEFSLDAGQEQVNADLAFDLSDALLLNDIAVDRPRGGPVRTVDQTSVDTFGAYAEQVSTILTTDQETQAFGQWQVSRRATPAPRAGRVSIDPFTEPSLYPIALGTELGTKGTLDNLPATAPASSVDVIVEGIEHTFSVDGWTTTWDASPGDDTTYLVWDSDTWDNARWAW